MKNFEFPGAFFDFSNGVDCSDNEINSWINQCFRHIKKEIEMGVLSPHASIRTGNSMVIMQAYKQEDGKYTVAVTVSKAYYEHTEIDVAI